jgi:hypothetical protein
VVLPGVTVVMPCKGVHSESYQNWTSQVHSQYDGPLEFIFAVESIDDDAYGEIQRLIKVRARTRRFVAGRRASGGRLSERIAPRHADCAAPRRARPSPPPLRRAQACPSLDIKLVAAGLSFHCSQKIHNILAAVEMASRRSAYLVILDDDIKLHPCSFRAWVDEMEGDPDVFVATGYSFDWAGPGAFGLPTRLVMMWRMVSMGAFMNTRPSSVWGGALMFRREELHRNVHGIIDAWRDGGYSEDFILIALCRKHGRTIASPLSAIFLNRLAPFSWERYWNYVRRQVFVLFTWTFAYMRFMQILMQLTLIIHNGAGACAAVGLVAVVGGALSRLGGAALTAGSEALAHGASARDALAAGRAGAGLAAAELASPCGRTALFAGLFACVLLLLASVMKVHCAHGPSAHSTPSQRGHACPQPPEARAHGPSLIRARSPPRPLADPSVAPQVAIRCLATLCNELSPPTSPGGNGISVSVGHVSVCGLAGCYVLHTWVVVVAYVRTWLDLRVVWSGVRFTIGSGRVVKVERKDPAGAWFTQPFERTLEHALERTARHATSRLHTGGS